MKKTLLKSALMAIAGVGLLAGSAMALQIDLTVDSNTTTIVTDGGVGDLLVNQTGEIGYTNNDFFGWDISFTGTESQLTDPIFLKITNFSIESPNTNSTLVITATETFTGDPIGLFTELNGTFNNFATSNYTVIVTDNLNASSTLNLGAFPNSSDLSGTLNLSNLDFTQPWTLKMVTTLSGANGSAQFDGITNAVPEPATMLLFGTGLAGLAGIARRRKK